MYCTHCGSKQDANSRFCSACGTRLPTHNTPQTSGETKEPLKQSETVKPVDSVRNSEAEVRKGAQTNLPEAIGATVSLGLSLLCCVVFVVMWQNRDNDTSSSVATTEATNTVIPEESLLIPNCDAAGTTSTPVSRDRLAASVEADGVTYQVVGAVGGLEFPQLGSLEVPDEDFGWIVLSLSVRNESGSSINLDSDDFEISVGDETCHESSANAGSVANATGLKDMGNIIGTNLEHGEPEVFSLAYEVPRDGRSYRLDLTEIPRSIDLVPFLQRCDAAETLQPTPTSIPSPTLTPVPGPTRTPRATFTPSPTRTPGPSPTPTQIFATEAPRTESPTQENATNNIPAGTDHQTVTIMNNPERYQNTRITIQGEVYIIDQVGEGQTAFVITDEETYFFNVVYDGALPAIQRGDVVVVTGILLDRTVQGSPLVDASSVHEP